MKKFPHLIQGKLTVRLFTEADITEAYVAWLNDPDVVRYSEQRHQRHNLHTCRAYFSCVSASDDLFLAIELKGCGHVGNIGVTIDWLNGVGDIAIILGEKRFWGLGIARQALTMVMNHCFEVLGLRKVTAGTMSVNKPMMRLIKSVGMRVEGVRIRQYLWQGKEVDLVMAAAFSRSERVSDAGLMKVAAGD